LVVDGRIVCDLAMRVAAVDCGTNSLRLLIADLDPGTGSQVDV
jgi:exopolyphosphatase/guanosine-5'-triphosphate,3'-diphosphate pyrophosphatase